MSSSTAPYTPSGKSTGKLQIIEEQRAALYKELMTNAQSAGARQALLRLINPQYVKQAAGQGIFLAYARSDELFAIELAEDLRRFGAQIWLDITDIQDDEDWREAVATALQKCGLMLAVISDDALNDDDLREEILHFMANGKIVLPLVYQHLKNDHLALWTQPVDFRHDYTIGLNMLQRLLTPSSADSRPVI